MTRKEFVKVAAELRSIYPAARLFQTPAALMAWFDALQQYRAETITKATYLWTRTHREAPTLAEFRVLAAGVENDRPQWNDVQEARRIRDAERRREEADA